MMVEMTNFDSIFEHDNNRTNYKKPLYQKINKFDNILEVKPPLAKGDDDYKQENTKVKNEFDNVF